MLHVIMIVIMFTENAYTSEHVFYISATTPSELEY